MVVLFKGYNNHSNRLMQAIHLEAFCMEHGLNFYNPSFWKMKGLYGIQGKPTDPLVWSILCTLNKIRLLPKIKFNQGGMQEEYEQMLLQKKLVFVHGWRFRNFVLTEKYQKELVAKYSLLPKWYEANELYNQVLKLDRSTYHLVGVHVRKGDYRTWKNGIYYFEDAVYQTYMDNLKTELQKTTGKQTVFILFSNETLQIQPSDTIIRSKNPWYVDQKIMSLCDYLIGPPSTFTLWASFLGNAKYYQITDDSGKMNLDEFVSSKG
ncbi:MAG: alpha-1,2-fucosyltransferase [Bacteroidia bacterium]|nr:alpha-1,2-fucosyltransferase [Bacteroidia bacterium]